MDGSSSQHDASLDDLFSLLSNDADEEARERVVKAMYDPEHPYSYFLRQPTGDEEFVAEWPPTAVPGEVASPSPRLQPASVWLKSQLAWKTAQTAIQHVVAVVDSLQQQVKLMPLTEGAKLGPGESPKAPTTEQIAKHLEQGKPLICSDDAHWLHIVRRDDRLRLRIGTDSANRFTEFSILFTKDETQLLEVNAINGEVAIDDGDLVRIAEADTLAIRTRG